LNAGLHDKRGAMHPTMDRLALQRISTFSVAKETAMLPKLGQLTPNACHAGSRPFMDTLRAVLSFARTAVPSAS
jgi:hypothetical protein